MADDAQLKPPITIAYQPPNGGLVTLGTGRALGAFPTGINWASEQQGGSSELRFDLPIDAKIARKDLESFTELVGFSGSDPVWSGRVIRTPTARDTDSHVHVEAQGWWEHFKDDPLQEMWVHSSLGDWKDYRNVLLNPAALATWTHAWNVTTGEGKITIGVGAGNTAALSSAGGAIIDAGYHGAIARYSLTWYGGGVANMKLTAFSSNDMVSFTQVDLDSAPITVALTTNTLTLATPARYLLIACQATGALTGGATAFCSIENIRLYADAAYESGQESALTANPVLESLLTKVPKISSSTSEMEDASFAIPEFHTGLGRAMYPDEVVAAVNAYHGWQTMLTPDPLPKFVFRSVPTVPKYAIGVQEDYSFELPSTNDGSDIFSQVRVEYTTATGVMESVTVASGAEDVQKFAPSAVSMSNPSFTTNTSGWVVVGASATLTRDTITFDTTPASGKIVLTGASAFTITSPAFSGMTVGRKYRLVVPAAYGGGERLAFRVVDSNGRTLSTVRFNYSAIGFIGFPEILLPFVATEASGTTLVIDYWDPTVPGGGSTFYIDSLRFEEDITTIVDRREFTRTKTITLRSKTTFEAALQIGQIVYDTSRRPPLRGTVTVEGWLRRHKTNEKLHVSKLRAGEMILIEDMQDPDTGAIGRQGIIDRIAYDADTDRATISIDNGADYVDNLLARFDAVTPG